MYGRMNKSKCLFYSGINLNIKLFIVYKVDYIAVIIIYALVSFHQSHYNIASERERE